MHPHTTKLPPLSRGTSRVGGCYRIPPMLLYRMYPEGSWAVAESPLPSRLRLLKSDPFETAPDLRLPPPIEALYGGLESWFSRRCEHGSHAEQETGSHHPANNVGVAVRPDEDVAVIKLCVSWQPKLGPVLDQ